MIRFVVSLLLFAVSCASNAQVTPILRGNSQFPLTWQQMDSNFSISAAAINANTAKFALYVPLTGATLTGPLVAPTLSSSNATVTGGTINNVPIGATTPASVAATTLSSTGLASLNGLTVTNAPTFSTPVGIASGGTGAATQSAALSAILGASSVPIANGGTNATTATGATGNLQYLQGATGAIARSLTSKFQDTINLKDFGATCNGSGTGDEAAMNAAFAALTANTQLILPFGNCLFSTAKTLPIANNIAIIGAGPGATVLTYTGANTTNDIITIGNGSTPMVGWHLSNFRVTSSTKMTSGATFHLKLLSDSWLDTVISDGQPGSGNTWNGYWFDGANEVALTRGNAQGGGDGIIVNGSGSYNSDLYIAQSYSDFNGGCGIRAAGGFGGLFVSQSEFLGNHVCGYAQDNSINAAGNREIIFDSTVVLDGLQTNTPNLVYINDSASSGSSVILNAHVGSATTNNVYVKSFPSGVMSIGSGRIYNSLGDGIRVDDTTATIQIGANTIISLNAGYGVDATASTQEIYSAANLFSNTSGNFTANAHVSGTGYKKYSDGTIQMWGSTTLTGAANTGLFSTVTLPFAFPTSIDSSHMKVSISGYANGVQQITPSIAAVSNSQIQVGIIATTTVTSAQTVLWEVWGN